MIKGPEPIGWWYGKGSVGIPTSKRTLITIMPQYLWSGFPRPVVPRGFASTGFGKMPFSQDCPCLPVAHVRIRRVWVTLKAQRERQRVDSVFDKVQMILNIIHNYYNIYNTNLLLLNDDDFFNATTA